MKNNFTQYFLIICMVTSTSINAQMLFENSVDNSELGVYTREELLPEWKTTSGNGFARRGVGENRVAIVQYGVTGLAEDRCLKVKYPVNTHDSKANGAQWKTNLDGVYNELYMSYYVKFGENFGLDKIGKLPGFGGGVEYNDPNSDTEWSGRLMWREGGRLQFYLKQPLSSLKQFDWPRTFESERNQWYHIELHYRMNTPGINDGLMEAWLDGKFISRYTDITFRDNNNVGITEMLFSTFFGGNDAHEPTQDNYAYFDDFKVSESRIGFVEPETLSLNSANQNSGEVFKVYPNPSTNGVINVLNSKATPLTLELFTVTGKSIYVQTASSSVIKLSKSNLNSGLYILKVKSSNKTEYKKIFVK